MGRNATQQSTWALIKEVSKYVINENSQQEDIPPLELGQAFAEHRDKFHLSRRELSEIIGIPMSRIETYEELYINLHGTAKHYVESGEIDASTAIKLTKNGERVIFWGFIVCAIVVSVAYFGYHNDRTVFAFGLVASWLFVVKTLSIPPDRHIRIWWL